MAELFLFAMCALLLVSAATMVFLLAAFVWKFVFMEDE
jgi:hypothetical protein